MNYDFKIVKLILYFEIPGEKTGTRNRKNKHF